MTFTEILLIILALLLVVNLLVSIFKKPKINIDELKTDIHKAGFEISKIDPLIRSEFSGNRQELASSLKSFSEQLTSSSKDGRMELTEGLKSFEEKFSNNIKDLNELQRQKFNDFAEKQNQIKTETEAKLE